MSKVLCRITQSSGKYFEGNSRLKINGVLLTLLSERNWETLKKKKKNDI